MKLSLINFSTGEVATKDGTKHSFEPFGENLVFQEPEEGFFEWMFEGDILKEDVETPDKDHFTLLEAQHCKCSEMDTALELYIYFEMDTDRKIFAVRSLDNQYTILKNEDFN